MSKALPALNRSVGSGRRPGRSQPRLAVATDCIVTGLRKLLSLVTPPIVYWIARAINRHVKKPDPQATKSQTRFIEFPSSAWADLVERGGGGYSAEVVVQAVVAAAREVRAGRGIYERDGVVFDRIEYYWPTLAVLMLAAAKFRGELHLVDFGGSLGTAYFQNKRFFDRLPDVCWTVVEQQSFVSIGTREFATDRLDFAISLDEAASRRPIDVILCSAVVQYLEASQELLSQFADTTAQFLILDRVLMHDGDSDVLTLQIVPDWIYKASYPCWVFSRSQLLARLDQAWVIIEEIPALETRALTDSGRMIYWTGFVLQRRAD